MKITIIDSIMGSGKTSWAIQQINGSPCSQKFIYITPFLSEISRVIKSTDRKFVQPDAQNVERSKLRGLKSLIADGYNIAATHSLFRMADDELLELLRESNYTLILDEVMDVVEKANINEDDIRALLKSHYVEIVDNRVKWIYDGYADDDGRFRDIRLLANAGNLFYHRGKFLIWAFPAQIFEAFDHVTVLTYMFNAQIMRYYFDLYNITYSYKSVKQIGPTYKLADYDQMNEPRQSVIDLIDLYDGPLNAVGDDYYALSANKLRHYSEDVLDRIQRNIYTFFRKHAKAKRKEIIWTTIKDVRPSLSGAGYARSFISSNIRATNDYVNTWALAYVFNRFQSPIITAFFEDNRHPVDDNLLAVSDLLQWVWRSRIRNGQPIKLYLPSSRMRGLLLSWGNFEI